MDFVKRRAILSVLALAPFSSSACPENENPEYQVKAAFLFNFLKFIEWPAAASNDSPWVIGVLGHDPFGDLLDNAVRGEIVNGRPVEVRRYSHVADVKDCSILFIGRAEFERVGTVTQPGLLTVGEAPDFLKSGGAVNFYSKDHRVHFEIRMSAIHSAGLYVSSQLLKLGRAR